MIRIRRRLVGALSVGCFGLVALACSGQGGDSRGVGQSVDPLLGGASGGMASSCATCIESACSSELAALEAELKTIHTATKAAFTCVQDSGCLSLFWSDLHDAGAAGAKQAVMACIAACDADAGVADRDAAESSLMMLAQALETCVDTSCASTCPGADHDAGGGHLSGAGHDAGTAAAPDSGGGNGTGIGSGSSGGGADAGSASDCGTGGSSGGGGRHHGF